jgi:hypothetical protein
MRLARILLLVQVLLTVAHGQDRSFLVGKTQDCFAGKIIHPAKVDIYLLDPVKSPEIARILDDMEKQVPKGNDQNVDAFFSSYQRLTSATRKTKPLGHIRSNETGDFVFYNLKDGMTVLLLGMAEREDEPAYYAYLRLKLQPGKNSVTLDFDQGSACKSQ